MPTQYNATHSPPSVEGTSLSYFHQGNCAPPRRCFVLASGEFRYDYALDFGDDEDEESSAGLSFRQMLIIFVGSFIATNLLIKIGLSIWPAELIDSFLEGVKGILKYLSLLPLIGCKLLVRKKLKDKVEKVSNRGAVALTDQDNDPLNLNQEWSRSDREDDDIDLPCEVEFDAALLERERVANLSKNQIRK
jgi:hypothetical protein